MRDPDQGVFASLGTMPREVRLLVVKMLVKEAPRDWMRLLGIRPGKLRVPAISVAPHRHGRGYATVSIDLPNFKQYLRQRTVHYARSDGSSTPPTGDDLWERMSYCEVSGHPDVPAIFEGQEIKSWIRLAGDVDSGFVTEDEEEWND